MNRKQRRATHRHGRAAGSLAANSAGDEIETILAGAAESERASKFDDAVRAYKRVLQLRPGHAEACNNLGRVLLAQGKPKDASAYFARALALMPQLLKQYAGICATLTAVLPPFGNALRKQAEAWPQQLTEGELFGETGLAAIAGDPLLLQVMQSIPVQDIAFERLLTSLRRSLLNAAQARAAASDAVVGFACALARQCFINEYVFATTPDEDSRVEQLRRALGDALASDVAPDATAIAILAMYEPLHAQPFPAVLLARKWNPALDGVLTQQIREPAQETELRAAIQPLTTIDDDVSKQVRQQYEENPYPRWVHAAGQVVPVPIDQYVREQCPAGALTPIGKTDALDILVAGCGTGQIAVASAQKYLGARVLAVDLSLSSLAYARRSTPAPLAARVEYAQADILKLATIGRDFDVIDCSGVLHHMADPLEGWRILLSLLRPGGLMHLGFYSEAGRKDVAAARSFIADHKFGSTTPEIRRCRQELLQTALASLARFTDFFSTSECRDLLFHVHEARMTIPAINAFIADHRLKFLGFEFDAPVAHQLRNHFSASGWSLTDLGRWQEFESRFPDTFSGMYQFWVQKPAAAA
jgi:2-polyprenyl-3-methyl-5-hydroxy-6-metoxy-1,4-benzoquinol methylase